MVEPFEREWRTGERGLNAGPCGDCAYSSDRDAGLALKGERSVAGEFRWQRHEQLEVLAALRCELLGRNTEPARFLETGRGHRQRIEIELEGDARRVREMMRVATEAVAQIEHRACSRGG